MCDLAFRSSLRVLTLTALLASAVVLSPGASAADSPGFRAGAATVDISPPEFPVIVNAMFTERTATETVDRLHTRALVLDDGKTKIALAVVDSCMVPRTLIDQAKAEASRQTGIPVERMLISSTHTHSAPSAMGCLGSRVDPRYAAWLPARIAAAIVKASTNMVPAEIGWAALDDWEHTFNRRWIRRPDRLIQDPFGVHSARAHMHPGHESADAIGPSGPVDPQISIIALRTAGGEPLAVLANYSQHYYGSPLLSSDYYGRFAEHLARMLTGNGDAAPRDSAPPFVAIMSQGTSGDLMWMDYAAPAKDIGYDAYAHAIAEKVAASYRGMTFQKSPSLAMAERKLALGYRTPDEARLAWARETASRIGDRLPRTLPEIYALEAIYLHERPTTELVLQALRIGEVGIAAIPNEVYALTGLKLKAWSPLERTFNISLANGAEGYIPPPEQHFLGGYTTWPARTAGLEASAEPKIVETLLSLLEEVSGRSRRSGEHGHGPYAMKVLEDRPVAYWRLNDMVMPRARDATSNKLDATYENGVALYLPGPGSGHGVSPHPQLTPSAFSGPTEINRAIHFAGGRLRAKAASVKGNYTIEFWFWNGLPHSARAVTGHLFSRGRDGDADARGDHLAIGGKGSESLEGRLFFATGKSGGNVLAGRTPLSLRRWYHVAVVREGSEVRVYLDGGVEPEIAGTADVTLDPADSEFFFGGRCDGSDGLEGRIDEVALYDRALEAREIARHYQLSGLAAYGSAGPVTATPPLSPEESLARVRVTRGLRVELVAAEPLLADPVAIDWDTRGRLWVAEMADYPSGMDGKGKPGGRIRVLEDLDGDGRYDSSRVFADGLAFPNGLLTWRDGVLVTAAPDVLFLRDTDGDGVADQREVLLSGFLEGNQQLRVNGLRWGLDNWVYCAAGGHHRGHASETRVRSHRAGTEVPVGSRDFRFKPDTGELDPQSGPTQFGRNRDDWGHWFGTQNSWPLWHYVLPDHYLRRNPYVASPDPVQQVITPMNPPVYPISRPEKRYHSFEQAGHFTSACSGMIYRDTLLPGSDDARFGLVCEPFHNLVQRVVVLDDGTSYRSTRLPQEVSSDLFASEDSWCRPVMVRTGPDGAVWVVDMYRYMIEHPDWLPEEGRAELLPHYRAGDDKGRIYRVTPQDTPARRVVWPEALPTAQLVAALESSNGWMRDKVHQILLWRPDPNTPALLENLLDSTRDPRARVHALSVLDGLGALRPERIAAALADPHPGVRENALRLAEAHGRPELIRTATRLVDDPDPKVRLQLAFTLGQWAEERAGEALATLAVRDGKDPYVVAAVMSSALPHLQALVRNVTGNEDPYPEPLFSSLLQLAFGMDRREALEELLTPVLSPVDGAFRPAQVAALNRFLEVLSRRSSSVEALIGQHTDRLATLLGNISRVMPSASRIAQDANASAMDRIEAARFLMRDEGQFPIASRVLAEHLTPRQSHEVQLRAVAALATTGKPEAAGILLEGWQSYVPRIRSAVLETLSRRGPWAMELLDRVAAGVISRNALDASSRSRLLHHGDRRVREQANAVLNSGTTPARDAIIAEFRPALSLKGDPARGAELYQRLCMTCHVRGNQGNPVGPDLRSVVHHPPEKLLVSILDPNQEVLPGYHAFNCTLSNGEEFFGVITAETANSVVLKLADGSTRTISREEIAELSGSGLSLMPEGLEAGLKPQDMADLITFLRTP